MTAAEQEACTTCGSDNTWCVVCDRCVKCAPQAHAGCDPAAALTRVRAKCEALLDGELAHRSRDYGRGVAPPPGNILAAIEGRPA